MSLTSVGEDKQIQPVDTQWRERLTFYLRVKYSIKNVSLTFAQNIELLFHQVN